jgi:hypothetical protein
MRSRGVCRGIPQRIKAAPFSAILSKILRGSVGPEFRQVLPVGNRARRIQFLVRAKEADLRRSSRSLKLRCDVKVGFLYSIPVFAYEPGIPIPRSLPLDSSLPPGLSALPPFTIVMRRGPQAPHCEADIGGHAGTHPLWAKATRLKWSGRTSAANAIKSSSEAVRTAALRSA